MINAYYEHQYHTRVGVENVPGIFEQWQLDSEIARRDLTCHIDVPYGDANRETVDLFIAEGAARWVVFIHGGYWRVMTAGHFSYLATPFVKAGWNVAMVEYDLCPNVTMHTLTEQCRRGIAWLSQHAGEYSGGCDEMIITGHSAGGHLTAMMFATDWSQYGMDDSVIKGGIAISGLFDLDPISFTKMNEDLKLNAQSVAELSPARLAPTVNAPLVITLGALESLEFHRQADVIKGAPGWDAIATEPVILANMHHFNILDDFMNLDGEMWGGIPG